MSLEALQSLSDRSLLFNALRQDQLAAAGESLGDYRWEADLAAGTLTFVSNEDPTRTIVCGAQLVASIAPRPRSLKWAWSLPDTVRDDASRELRTYGEQHGVWALTAEELPFPDDIGPDMNAWLVYLGHIVGASTVEITGRSPFYAADVGGTRAVLLLDAPIGPLTVATALTALPRILSEYTIPDPRTAVWDLARLAGWHLDWADAEFSAATVTDATGSATFHFDEHARISNIEARLGPQG